MIEKVKAFLSRKVGNYERAPFTEHVKVTLSVLACIADLNVPDAVAEAPEQYEEALEKFQSGDSSEYE